MRPISGVNTVAAQPLTTAEKMMGASKNHKPAEKAQGRRLKPVTDEYVRPEPGEPSGRYWIGRDEDGRPKVYFDNPERAAADGPKQPEGAPKAEQGTKGPEKKDGEGERWACNTGKVDREIEKLKKKQQELEQRRNTETDGAKLADLERQLAQVARELRQKDNDTYRKQHSTFTRLS